MKYTFQIGMFLAAVLLISVYLAIPRGIMVKSNVDGKWYTVKNDGDKQRNADLLAEVNKRINLLVSYLKSKPDYNKNLDRYSSIKQNIFDIDTAYTLNKRDTVFCLGYSEPIEINTLMYVAIHELSHIASDGVGHGPEFTGNFKVLLREAINTGVYKFVEYSSSPVDYCGVEISRNVLSG